MKKILLSLVLVSTAMFAKTDSDVVQEILQKNQSQFTYEAFFELAKSGDIDAQTLLGEMYLDGIGVEKDPQKAFFWLSKAAKKEDPQAQYLLGTMYENGIYVSTDMHRAVKWYKEAALQGDVMAQYNLALIYKDGKGGVQKDLKEAFKWLKMVEAEEDKVTKVAMK